MAQDTQLQTLRGTSAPTLAPGRGVRIARRAGRFARTQPLGAVGAAVILIMLFMAVAAPVITTQSTERGDPSVLLQSPSSAHFFGTDHYGRDVFTRIVYGSRVSLYTGFGSLAVAITIAITLGLISGYFGGILDMIMQRFIDAAMAFPALVLLLVLVSVFGAGLLQLIIALGVLGALGNTRIVRSAVLTVRQNQYIEAARVLGASHSRILLRHILPNIFGPVMVVGTVWLGAAIIAEASLSFLGLGIPPPTPSWGRMLSEARSRMLEAPTLAVFPGLAIALAVFSFNILGDALRDILDPRLRKG